MAAAILSELGGISNFDCTGDASKIGPRWKRRKRAFELYIEGKGVTDDGQKRALLLHCAGMDVQDVFYTLPEGEGENPYEETMSALDKHFTPQVNVPYERHLFRNMTQSDTETVEQFITKLRQQSETCEFGENLNEQLRDQVIEKCKSHNLRRKLLEKGRTLTLEQLCDISRAMELSEKQARNMEGIKTEVNRVQVQKHSYQGYRRSESYGHKNSGNADSGRQITCYRCGKNGHISKDKNCPALDQECRKCQKKGHFEKCCKTQFQKHDKRNRRGKKTGVHHIRDHDNTLDDHEYAFSIQSSGNSGFSHNNLKTSGNTGFHDNKLKANRNTGFSDQEHTFNVDSECSNTGKQSVVIGGVRASMMIDSGASCNILGRDLWENLKKKGIKCESRKTEKLLYPYGSSNLLKTAGAFTADVSVDDGNKVESVEFIVIEGPGQPLLGRETSLKLGVLKLGPQINSVNSEDDFVKEFSDCFQGLGKLKNFELKISIDKSVQPVAQPTRRIPFQLRDKLSKKLDELEKLEIIERVEGPTPWVSPVVVVPKANLDIRLCVDTRQTNTAVLRERHPIPTVDEILQDLNESTIFSKAKWNNILVSRYDWIIH